MRVRSPPDRIRQITGEVWGTRGPEFESRRPRYDETPMARGFLSSEARGVRRRRGALVTQTVIQWSQVRLFPWRRCTRPRDAPPSSPTPSPANSATSAWWLQRRREPPSRARTLQRTKERARARNIGAPVGVGRRRDCMDGLFIPAVFREGISNAFKWVAAMVVRGLVLAGVV